VVEKTTMNHPQIIDHLGLSPLGMVSNRIINHLGSICSNLIQRFQKNLQEPEIHGDFVVQSKTLPPAAYQLVSWKKVPLEEIQALLGKVEEVPFQTIVSGFS
jgi:hypothetical protein